MKNFRESIEELVKPTVLGYYRDEEDCEQVYLRMRSQEEIAETLLASDQMKAIQNALNWIAYTRGEHELTVLGLPKQIIDWVLE